MSIELKQAAQQAVDAFDAFGDDDDFASLFALAQKMKALHTAIQQAEAQQPDNAACKSVQKRLEAQQPSTPEPVGEPFCFASVNKHGDVTSTHKRRDSWRTIPLYSHPAPGVPGDVVRDAQRYRWLRKWKGQEHEPPFTVQHEFDGTIWGGDLDSAIDAAMLAAQAQKGQQ